MPARSRLAERGPLNSRPLPVLQLLLVEIEAGIGREVRRTNQLAAGVVGPAVNRADDVLGIATALQHERLSMATDIRHVVVAIGLVHQHAAMIQRFLGAVVMDIGDHQLVADIARTGIEDKLFLQCSKSFSSKYQDTGSCVAAGESSAARAMSDMIPNLQEDHPETENQ